MCASFSRDWDEANPTDNTNAVDIDNYNRYLRVDVSDRIKTMVYGFTAGENDGLPGFKELIFKQQAAAPGTPNADEITLYCIDDGAAPGLYAIQEDGYAKQILKKSGTALILNIAAADGVCMLTGNQTVAGNKTFSGTVAATSAALTTPVLTASVSGTAVLDEDDMATDSATQLATQQSIKAYIAAQLALTATGGAPTLNDADATAMLKAHVYKAATAGFVNAYVVYPAVLQIYVAATDLSPAGGTKLADVSTAVGSGYNTGTVFVPKGYYFDVASGGTPTIYWTPLVSGGAAPADQD